MARSPKPLILLLVLVISFSLLLAAKARPLNDANDSFSTTGEESQKNLDGLHVAAIETGGPSEGGKGHKLMATSSAVDQSGPSPGEGH